MRIPRVIDAFLRPRTSELERALSSAWERVPERFRVPFQFLGRQYAGCGATIGSMPRCDFTCSGCYLGGDANAVPALPLSEIRDQIRVLRRWLGPSGNLQITDGEMTLRPEAELIEMIRAGRREGLVPMLMTHGETFRRKPGLLERLMVHGGLSEISIHIDTTMNGRRDSYRGASTEADLDGLRDRFAGIIREARRKTGLPLEAASTVTVTRENLAGVSGIIRWFMKNSDAFKMVSFQPIAQVGRTEDGLGGGVSVDALWAEIAKGLGQSAEKTEDSQGWMGHPGCSRFLHGLVVHRRGREARLHPFYRRSEAAHMRLLPRVLGRLGGTSLRLDSRTQGAARIIGAIIRNPILTLWEIPRYVWSTLTDIDPNPFRLWREKISGRLRTDYFNIVSHHFMSQEELETPTGRERLGTCVFKVPMNGELVTMCEANAAGRREAFYREGAGRELSVQS